MTINKISSIANTETTVLWKLPQGVPDSSSPLRQPLKPTQGNACWIDVFQYFLHGSRSTEDSTVLKTESFFASFREKSTALERSVSTARSLLDVVDLGLADPQNAQKNAGQNLDKIISLFRRNNIAEYQPAVEIIQKFATQTEIPDLHKFLTHNQNSGFAAIYKELFKNLELDPTSLLPNQLLALCAQQQTFKKIEDLSSDRQYIVYNLVARAALTKIYSFPSASWQPGKGIDLLFKEVQSHGVIGFDGFFGRGAYTAEPKVVLTIAGCEIFGWKSSERKKTDFYGHSIGVVGVKKETDETKISSGNVGYVIYINPTDGSDPQDPKKQKFYLASYKVFEENVMNQFNMKYPIEDMAKYETGIKQLHPSLERVGYGLLPNPPYVFGLANLARLWDSAGSILKNIYQSANQEI